MNVVILYGKILSEIEFKFFYNNKNHISVATFKLMPNSKIGSNRKQEIINIKAYDNYADIIYKNFKEGDFIGIKGYLNKDGVCVQDVTSTTLSPI